MTTEVNNESNEDEIKTYFETQQNETAAAAEAYFSSRNAEVKADPGIGEYALDIVQGVAKGPMNAVKNAANLLADVTGMERKTPWMDYLLENSGKLDTTPGHVTEGFSRFISSFMLLRGYGSATTKVGQLKQAAVKGAVVDFTIWDKEDGRLTTMLADHGVDNVVVNYLKSDPNDSVFEDKFKHALEGIGLGVSVDVLLNITKIYRGAKEKLWAKHDNPDAVAQAVDDMHEAGELLPKPKTDDIVNPQPEGFTKAKFEETVVTVDGVKPPEVAFNYEKILKGLDESLHDEAQYILENITKSQDFIKFAKTGVKPHDITVKQAKALEKKLGFDGTLELATKTVKDAQKLDAQLIVLKRAMSGRLEHLSQIVKDAPDATDKVALLNGLRELQTLHILTAGAKSLQQGGARVTSAGRIEIFPKAVLEKLDEIAETAPDVLKMEADKIINDVTAKKIHKLLKGVVDVESDITLHRVMKGLDKKDHWLKKTINVLTEVRLTSLLSGPVTLGRNIAGNYFVRKASNLEYRMAGVIGKMRNDVDRFKSDEIEALTHGSLHQSYETVKGVFKAIQQLPKGTKAYEDALEEGYLDFYQKYDTGSYRAISKEYLLSNTDTPIRQFVGQTIDGIGALIRTPYQALGITDDMFKRVIYGSEIKYIGTREANIRGLQGVEKQNFIKEFYAAHEALFLKGKGADALSEAEQALIKKYIAPNKGKWHTEAIERSREGTFQEELRLHDGNGINKGLYHIDKAIKAIPGGQWVIPFYRTPVNLMKWVGRRTPGLHKLSQRMMDDIAAGGRRKALAESRLVMGSSLYAISGMLAYNGMITGSAPANERAAWKAAGIAENSIYNPFTEEWVPFNGLDPVGTFLGLAAEINMFITDMERRGLNNVEGYQENLDELTGALVVGFSNQIVNKMWMKSFDELLSWTKGENPKYAEKTAATFIPFSSLANFVQNGEGDNLKEAIGLFEQVKKRFAPDTLRDQLDIFGKSQTLTSFLGMRTREPKNTPIREELMRLKMNIGKMDDRIMFESAEIQLEAEDHWKMRRLLDSHAHIEERLDKLITSSKYKNMPDGIDFDKKGTKKHAIKSYFADQKNKVKKLYIKRNPDRLKELKADLMEKIGTLRNQREGLYDTWLEKGAE